MLLRAGHDEAATRGHRGQAIVGRDPRDPRRASSRGFDALTAPKKTFSQSSPTESPWSTRERIAILLWEPCWTVFCRWTPKPLNGWRLAWLRLFKARISGRPFVHPRARIQLPWNLCMHDQSCLGDRANAYNVWARSRAAEARPSRRRLTYAGARTLPCRCKQPRSRSANVLSLERGRSSCRASPLGSMLWWGHVRSSPRMWKLM